MAQQPRERMFLAEEADCMPASTQWRSSPGPVLADPAAYFSIGTGTHGAHTWRQNTCAHKITFNSYFKKQTFSSIMFYSAWFVRAEFLKLLYYYLT